MVFDNCGTESNSEPCHQSCQECDGPTKSDCLSCDPSTNRIYNVKQKTCVCVYGKIDLDGECIDYSFYSLYISQGNKEEFTCSYGYFETEDQCWKCPSKIRGHIITCIECITNPKTWINNPYCYYNFVTDNNERPFTKQDDGMEEYFFDEVDIKLTENLEQHSDIYSDYILTFNHFQNFCQNCLIDLLQKQIFFYILKLIISKNGFLLISISMYQLSPVILYNKMPNFLSLSTKLLYSKFLNFKPKSFNH